MKRRWTMYGVLAAVTVGMLASVVPASASSTGRRNTALALAGLSAYELLNGKTGPGLLLGAGAAYAWKRANDEQRAEERDYYYGYSPYAYRGGYYGYNPGNYRYRGGYYGYSGRDGRRYDRDRDRDDWGRGRHEARRYERGRDRDWGRGR